MKKRSTLENKLKRIEEKLVKLESRTDAKKDLNAILNSGYTPADIKKIKTEIETGHKDYAFNEIVKDMKAYSNTTSYYISKSNSNDLFDCVELDNDLLDLINSL